MLCFTLLVTCQFVRFLPFSFSVELNNIISLILSLVILYHMKVVYTSVSFCRKDCIHWTLDWRFNSSDIVLTNCEWVYINLSLQNAFFCSSSLHALWPYNFSKMSIYLLMTILIVLMVAFPFDDSYAWYVLSLNLSHFVLLGRCI